MGRTLRANIIAEKLDRLRDRQPPQVLDLFAGSHVVPPGAPGAHRAAGAMQIPVYASLTDEQASRVARVVRGVLAKSVGRASMRTSDSLG